MTEAQAQAETQRLEQPACLIDNCDEPARWKGLCGKCYHQANKLVKANEYTWEQLAEMGLAELPPSPFIAALNKKLQPK